MRALLLACALAVAAARDDAATVRTLEDRLKKLDGHESQMSSAEKSKLTAMRQRLSALKRSMGDEDAPQSLERTPSRHQIEAAEEEPAHELERDAASPAALESRYRKLKAKVDSTPELKDDAEVMSTLRSVEKKLKAASGGASHASHAAKAAPASLERTASDGRTVREIIRHAEEHLGAMEASGSSAERARARAAKKQFAGLSAPLGKSSAASAVSRALERVRGAVAEMNDPSGAEIAEAPRAKYAASLERNEEEDEVPELEEEEEEEADLERGGDARVGAVVKKLEAAVNTLKAKPDALAKSPELQQLLKRTRAHVADLEANLGVDGAARPPAGADMESGMEVRCHPPTAPLPPPPPTPPAHPPRPSPLRCRRASLRSPSASTPSAQRWRRTPSSPTTRSSPPSSPRRSATSPISTASSSAARRRRRSCRRRRRSCRRSRRRRRRRRRTRCCRRRRCRRCRRAARRRSRRSRRSRRARASPTSRRWRRSEHAWEGAVGIRNGKRAGGDGRDGDPRVQTR